MLDSYGFDLDGKLLSSKRKEDCEGIPIGLDGVISTSLNPWKVVIEELMKAPGELHSSP